MPTEAKRETVAELREELSRNPTLIISEYRGLTVGDLAEVRRALRKQNVTYRVVKNRLMRIAATTPSGRRSAPSWRPTAIAFASDRA
jgi:large subunit ribosomal protein L10